MGFNGEYVNSDLNYMFIHNQPRRLDRRHFGNPTFNQPGPNWGLHLTPLRGAGEAGRSSARSADELGAS